MSMVLHSMQYNDPHSSYNQGRLAANNPEYAALREEAKLAAESGNQAQATTLKTKLHEMEATTFEARQEAQRQQIINLGKNAFYFGSGLGNALSNNLSLGAMPRDYLSQPAFLYGQRFGDGLSIMVGDGMMGAGTLIMVPTVGIASPIAVPLSAGGAALAGHGGVVMGKALLEFRAVDGEYQGKESGRNEKHANPEAKSTAQQNYEKAEAALAKYKAESTGKSDKGRREEIKRLEGQVQHWKKQADFPGDTHGRRGKGKGRR